MTLFLSPFKRKPFYIGILRYSLSFVMMGYGCWKMKGYQGGFVHPTSAWQLPLEALTGQELIWIFVGHSRWLQFLLGAMEFFPSVLLLFRRTQLLGAVLLLPATAGVLIANYAFDLWEQTKIASPILFAANAIILLSEPQKIKEIGKLLLSKLTRTKYSWVEYALNIFIIIFVARKLFTPLYHEAEHLQPFCGDCFNKHPNEWILVQETINDSIVPLRNLRCYFTPRGCYTEIHDNNRSPDYLIYDVDKDKKKITIEKGYYYTPQKYLLPDPTDSKLVTEYTYAFNSDSTMHLQLAGQEKHSWTFRRSVINKDVF